eukprot:8817821-Karenia_brevis.AAC.1
MSQTAQDLSWEIPESHVPAPKVPSGKAMAEQGLDSDKTTWADATDETWRRVSVCRRAAATLP